MRNLVDCELILTLPEYSIENILNGYTLNMKRAAHQAYKLNNTQIEKVYKILLYLYTKGSTLESVFEKYIKERYYKMYKVRKFDSVRKHDKSIYYFFRKNITVPKG